MEQQRNLWSDQVEEKKVDDNDGFEVVSRKNKHGGRPKENKDDVYVPKKKVSKGDNN